MAIDHPEGEEIYTNERFSSPPFEPFRLYAVSEKLSQVRATNHRGEDILQQLLEGRTLRVNAEFSLSDDPKTGRGTAAPLKKESATKKS